MDLSDCSRLLYHWAIPPQLYKTQHSTEQNKQASHVLIWNWEQMWPLHWGRGSWELKSMLQECASMRNEVRGDLTGSIAPIVTASPLADSPSESDLFYLLVLTIRGKVGTVWGSIGWPSLFAMSRCGKLPSGLDKQGENTKICVELLQFDKRTLALIKKSQGSWWPSG